MKKGLTDVGIIIGVVSILSLVVIASKFDLSDLSGLFTYNILNQPPNVNLNPSQQQDSSLWAKINLNPTRICVGDSATGSVTSNIPNGMCTIYYSDGATTNHQNIALSSSGSYSLTQRVMTSGTYTFQGACLDGAGRYAITNVATLIVDPCTTTTTTTPAKGDWKCCMYMKILRGCHKDICPKGWFEVSSHTTELMCKLSCKSTSPTTVTTTTLPSMTTTTRLSKISCESSWPRPMSQKDCDYRIGCKSHEKCTFHKGLMVDSFCRCDSKVTTTTFVTTTTRISNQHVCCQSLSSKIKVCTPGSNCPVGYVMLSSHYNRDSCIQHCVNIPTTTIPDCRNTCQSAGFSNFDYGPYDNDGCFEYADFYCNVYGGLDWWDDINGCCCWRCANPI